MRNKDIVPALLIFVGIAASIPASAGTKSKTFNVPSDVLYESAVQTAAKAYKLTSANTSSRSFAFRTGASAASWGLLVKAGVEPISADSSRLVLDVQNADSRQVFSWGAGGRVADNFFKDVEAMLANWRPVNYRLVLVKPAESETLMFEDENLKVGFALSRKSINFSLRNKTDNPIKVDWNQLSYVDIDGKSHKVFHKGIAYKDRETSLPPSIVPPTAVLEDMILPTDYSQWSDVGGGFWSLDLLPQSASAVTYVGKTFSLFMPVEINNTARNYLFSFKISQANINSNNTQ